MRMNFFKMVLLAVLCFYIFSIGTSFADGKYKRSEFGSWSDEDGNCLNTRHELLKLFSKTVPKLRSDGCAVVSGSWIDPYTAKYSLDPTLLDIDHLVPLKFAWEHGAGDWTYLERKLFSNNFLNLFVVDRNANRKKGALGPLDWMPSNVSFQCKYIQRFLYVIGVYDLKLSTMEALGYRDLELRICN